MILIPVDIKSQFTAPKNLWQRYANLNCRFVFFIPSKICVLFGNGLGDRFSLRISLLLLLVGVLGLTLEIINAFDYIQGARNGFKNSDSK